MVELNDIRNMNFYRLEESGNYSEHLLTQLRNGNHFILRDIESALKADKRFMEPLLYAYRERHSTYIIYQYLGEHLQENPSIAIDVILEEPEVIEGTLVSDNPEFILDMAEINPRVILYMADSLKSNEEFKERLSIEIEDDRIDNYLKIIENEKLLNEPEFMKEVIKKDPSMISQASEELKNNHEFIKETCKENKEVIDYVAEHTDEFGKEGLNGAKEVLVEDTTSKAIDEFKVELENLQKAKAISEETINADETEKEDGEKDKEKKAAIKERQLRNSIKFMEKIKNGEVKPERAIRLIDSLCDNLGEEYREEIMKYIKLDDAIIEKQKAEKDVLKIEPKNIEEVAKESQLSEIQAETSAIREEIIAEREEKQTNENNELGEQE